MSADGVAEQRAIETRLSDLCGGRVYVPLVEEEKLVRDTDTGIVLPYIVLSFGSVFPIESDRSIEGADQQPQLMPIIVECWASDYDSARVTAGAVRTLLLGWTPGTDGNASEIDLRGGSPFPSSGGAGRPSRYAETVTASLTINNSFVA